MHLLVATTGVLRPAAVVELCDRLLGSGGRVTVMTVIEVPRTFLQAMDEEERRSFLDDRSWETDTAQMMALGYLEERGRRAVDPIVTALRASGREPAVSFVEGGFDLGAAAPARGIRAFNVLRQYQEADVAPAFRAMGASILPGGLIVEGTSDPSGRAWTALLVRRSEADSVGGGIEPRLELEALVFGTNFRASLDAETFQAVLPKRLIHRVVPGEPVHAFMSDWARLRRIEAGSETWGPRYAFGRIALGLRAAGHAIEAPERHARRGWILWRTPPVPLMASG